MLKNWTVTTKQIKKSAKGIQNYKNYLHKKSDPAHAGTTIVPLKDSGEACQAILSSVDDRTTFRRENGLRGGGVRNYATSFVLSLPRDVKQPSEKEWKKIAANAVKAIAATNGLDAKELWKNTIAVMHFEKTKNNHLHLSVGNVHNNEVVKGISQLKTTFAVKQSFNKSMLDLGVDHKQYVPYTNGVKKPLWKAREEKLEEEIKKFEKEKKLFNKLKKQLNKFSVLLGKHLKKLLDNHDEQALQQSAELVVDQVENIGEISPKAANVAAKEAIKTESEYFDETIKEEVSKRKKEAAKQPSQRKRRRRKRTND